MLKLIGSHILVDNASDPQSPVAAEQSSIATFDPMIVSTTNKRPRSPATEGERAPPIKVFLTGLKTGQPMARSSVSESDGDSSPAQSSLRSPSPQPSQPTNRDLTLTPAPPTPQQAPRRQILRPLPPPLTASPPKRRLRRKRAAKKDI